MRAAGTAEVDLAVYPNRSVTKQSAVRERPGLLQLLRLDQGPNRGGENLYSTEHQPHHTKSDSHLCGDRSSGGRPRRHAIEDLPRLVAHRRGQAQGGNRASGQATAAPTAIGRSEALSSTLPAARVCVKDSPVPWTRIH